MPTALLFSTDKLILKKRFKTPSQTHNTRSVAYLWVSHILQGPKLSTKSILPATEVFGRQNEAGLSSTLMPTLPPRYATFTKCSLSFKPLKWTRSMPAKLHWTLYEATIRVNIFSALPLLSPAFLVSGLHMELIVSKNGPNSPPLPMFTPFAMWLCNSSH